MYPNDLNLSVSSEYNNHLKITTSWVNVLCYEPISASFKTDNTIFVFGIQVHSLVLIALMMAN